MVNSWLEISSSQKLGLYWQVKPVKIHCTHDTYHMIASPLIYQRFFKVHVINYKLKNLSCTIFLSLGKLKVSKQSDKKISIISILKGCWGYCWKNVNNWKKIKSNFCISLLLQNNKLKIYWLLDFILFITKRR